MARPSSLAAALRPHLASPSSCRVVVPSRRIASKVHAGLHYHAHPSLPGHYTLSYLQTPPPSLRFSPTTLGTLRPLPASPSSYSSSSFGAQSHPEADAGLPPITPRTLDENPDFLRLVHEIVQANIADDLWLQTQAKALSDDTHLHIGDERAPADANRVPAPQDILASVLVQQGKVVPESYEPNRVAYRLVTEDGLMRLPHGLGEKVREACKRVREVEEEVARDEQGGQGQ
ncbi:hypothetical protein Rhopal_001931-T1 [Rhodotorula paludigena]|uniref:Uncharacterized protein n=1 Tax=Rhodotorula paludigena TaxID=86838 RepID=A0AAV5GGT6_9BASI|nr:hypothetical protein Rhopal_001931-T1 [Rhodotorula paludigena]